MEKETLIHYIIGDQMTMRGHLTRQFSYNGWANRETLACLKRLTSPAPQALRFFAHILASEQLWQTRLRQISTEGFVVWYDWDVERCADELTLVTSLWKSYLGNLTAEMLLQSIPYTNSRGEAWQNTITDMLTHVIIHSGYHRGQIAAAIRASGGEPTYTDYIAAVRQGYIE
jgi:uncharacterized damage-inducible protein DinB